MGTFRYLILSALFLFAGSPASAQVSVAMLGGANLASTALASEQSTPPTPQTVTRLSLGVAADFPLARHFAIQFGGAYSQRGFNTAFTDGDVTGESLIEVDYAELTALGKLHIPLYGDHFSVHLLAGPAVGYVTSCDATLSAGVEGTSASTTEPCGDNLDRSDYDFGVVGGGGLEIGLARALRLNFGALYNYGLADVDTADDTSVKHRVLTLRTGLSYSIR